MNKVYLVLLLSAMMLATACSGPASQLASASSDDAQVNDLFNGVQAAFANTAFQAQLKSLSSGSMADLDSMLKGQVKAPAASRAALASFNKQYTSLDAFVKSTGVSTGPITKEEIAASVNVGRAFEAGSSEAPKSAVSPARLVYVSTVLAVIFTQHSSLGLDDWVPWYSSNSAGDLISNYNGARIYMHNDGNVTSDCGAGGAQTTHQNGANNVASCDTKPNANGQVVRATSQTTTDPNSGVTYQTGNYQTGTYNQQGQFVPNPGSQQPMSPNYLPKKT